VPGMCAAAVCRSAGQHLAEARRRRWNLGAVCSFFGSMPTEWPSCATQKAAVMPAMSIIVASLCRVL
jgi:hypothetical protein